MKINLKTNTKTFESSTTLKNVFDEFLEGGAFSTILVKHPPPRHVFNLTDIDSLNVTLGELTGDRSTELVLEALTSSR